MRVHKKLMIALALLASTGITGLASGEPADVKKEAERPTVQIQADSVAYSTETKEITASGNVVITMKDGSTLEGEKAVVKTDEGKASIAGDTIVFKQSTDQKK